MSSTRPRTFRPFLFAGLTYLLVVQIALCVKSIRPALEGHADFRAFYCTGYLVRTGRARQIYDYDVQKQIQNALVAPSDVALPFFHPAYEALLFVPFSVVSYRVGYYLFAGFNVALLVISASLMRPHLSGLASVWPMLPLALLLLFFPAGIALMQGQDSILLLALYSCVLVAIVAGNDFLAGGLLGLALMKFQIVLPMMVLFLIWRRWRMIAGFAAGSFAVLIASIWLVGLHGLIAHARFLLGVSSGLATSGDQLRNGAFPWAMPNLRGMLFSLGGAHLPNVWLQSVIVSVSLFVLWWAASKREEITSPESTFALAIVCALLVSYHLQIHDLTLLTIPIALWLDCASRKATAGEGIRTASLPGLFLVQPIYLLLTTHGLLWLLCLPMLALLRLWPRSDLPLPSSAANYPSADQLES
jgi:Glycosyltransferase family 87